MTLLNKQEQEQVAAAISAVERETDAEVVTVLTAQADNYAYIPLGRAHCVVGARHRQLLYRLAGRRHVTAWPVGRVYPAQPGVPGTWHQ